MRVSARRVCCAGLGVTAWACGPPAPGERAGSARESVDTTFRAPRRVTIRGYAGDAMEPFVTRDGRFLLFNSRNDPRVNTDVHYARAVDALTFEYAGPVRGINTAALEGVPTLDRDGTMYFVSTRSYAGTLSTVYRGRYAAGTVDHVALVAGLPRRRGEVIFDVEVSADGTALYYAGGTFRGGPVPESADLAIAVRRGDAFEPRAQSAALLANVNTPTALEYAAAVSGDGLELFFTRTRGERPAIYRAVRRAVGEPFAVAGRLVAIEGFAEAPALAADGRSLYYHARVGDSFAIFRVTRARSR